MSFFNGPLLYIVRFIQMSGTIFFLPIISFFFITSGELFPFGYTFFGLFNV